MSASGFYWCPSALLHSGWASDVLIEINQTGLISDIQSEVSQSAAAADCTMLNGTLLPGIANLHSHAHQRAMAGLGERSTDDGDSFWTWRQAMYRTLVSINPDQLFNLARMLYLEMLQAGYTWVAEFQYLHHDQQGESYANRAEMTLQCARAAADVGIGFTALPVLYNFGGFGSLPWTDGQKRFVNDAVGFNQIVESLKNNLASDQQLGIAPHSLRAVDKELLQQVLSHCESNILVHIHIAEQIKEVEDCVQWSGQRPVEWLYNHFEPNSRWCLIHATHMNDAETSLVLGSGAIAGLCPATEANLGDGFFSAIQFFNQRGNWGIGSDSHISVSPVEELRWLEYGARLLSGQRNVLIQTAGEMSNSGEQLLLQGAKGGAMACDSGSGVIEPGGRADFICLDNEQPRLYGREQANLVDSWIFSGNTNVVSDVVVAGAHVIRDGRHRHEHDIQHKFRKTIDQLADQ